MARIPLAFLTFGASGSTIVFNDPIARRRAKGNSGKILLDNIFWGPRRMGAAPAVNNMDKRPGEPLGESRRCGRMTRGNTPALAATRLRVLNSLPRRHQEHFFEVVRAMCAQFIAHIPSQDPNAHRQSETLELFSEVMAKLLGVAGLGDSLGQDDATEPPHAWPVDADPKRDGRVRWLIEQTGGLVGITHRREDMRRRQFGGKWKDGSYRQGQLDEEHTRNLGVDPDDPFHDDDVRLVWRGVLSLAQSQFEPNEDVSILLILLASDAEIQAGFGSEWPIRQIVRTLNQRHPNPSWNDDRVENAKKRLKNWIGRMRRDHGLDSTDLMDLFARCARGQGPGGKGRQQMGNRTSSASATALE